MPNEYRVVCRLFGEHRDHRTHAWPKRDQAKAEQSVLDLNHHNTTLSEDATGQGAKHWYAGESPHRYQVREVGEWADAEGV